ncbi:MAG: hypothetical protein ACKO04_08995 [Actinomycetes bacterium]
MWRRPAVLAGATVAATLLLLGCGQQQESAPVAQGSVRSSEDSSSRVRTSAQVCELVPAAVAVTATEAMVTPEPAAAGLPSCTWRSPREQGRELKVQFDRGAVAFDAFARAVDTGAISSSVAVPAEGVGESAFWDFSGGPGQRALRVRQGDDAVVVTVRSPALSDEQVRQRESDVVAAILPRLSS